MSETDRIRPPFRDRLLGLVFELAPEYGSRLACRVNHDVGWSGNGATLLDREPDRPMNRLERWLTDPSRRTLAALKRDAFRSACMEVLGEDPDEWGYE